MLNRAFLITVTICLFSCESRPYKVQVAYDLMHEHEKLQTKKGYYASSSGGAMFYGIEWMQMGYDIPGFADINRARRIAIELLDEFIILGKSDVKIKPFLVDNEFKESNVQIGINFKDNNNNYMKPPSIAHVFISKGKISYGEVDPVTGHVKIFEDLLVETIDEARQHLAEDSCLNQNNLRT